MRRTLTLEEWRAEGARLFGPDEMAWRFICPACDFVASRKDWANAGAPDDAVAFSCIGRWVDGSRYAFEYGPGPCDYAGGGRLRLNPVTVVSGDVTLDVFDFADPSKPVEGDVAVGDKYWRVKFRAKADAKRLRLPTSVFDHVPAKTADEAKDRIAAQLAKVLSMDLVERHFVFRSLVAYHELQPGGVNRRTGGSR